MDRIEEIARAITVAEGLNPDCLHQNYSDSEPVDGFTGPTEKPARKGWRRFEQAARAIAALSPSRAREEALEEASKVAEDWHPMLYAPEMGGAHPRDGAIHDAKKAIAAAIRARKGQPSPAELVAKDAMLHGIGVMRHNDSGASHVPIESVWPSPAQWPLDKAIEAFCETWPSFNRWWTSLDNGYGGKFTLSDIPPEPFEAFLLAAPPAQGWQPIETAPKGGERVLFLAPEDASISRVHIGWFNKWMEPCWQGLAHNPVPTHWQPLPAAPAPVSSAKEPQ